MQDYPVYHYKKLTGKTSMPVNQNIGILEENRYTVHTGINGMNFVYTVGRPVALSV